MYKKHSFVIRYRHMPNYEDGSLPVATGDRGH